MASINTVAVFIAVVALLCLFTDLSHAKNSYLMSVSEHEFCPTSAVSIRPFFTYPPLGKKGEHLTLPPQSENSLGALSRLICNAKQSVDIEVQIISKWATKSATWDVDPHPIIKCLVELAGKGVEVRVIVEETSDKQTHIADYLSQNNIKVKVLDKKLTGLSYNHNKGGIIDKKTVFIASVNFSNMAIMKNGESGIVIDNSPDLVKYFGQLFEYDFTGVERQMVPKTQKKTIKKRKDVEDHVAVHQQDDSGSDSESSKGSKLDVDLNVNNFPYPFADIGPRMIAFSNPDNSHKVITQYLETAKHSIQMVMYSMSDQHQAVQAMVDAAKRGVEVSVVTGSRRITKNENELTQKSIELLRAAGADVREYEVAMFQTIHAKFWIIDGRYVFVYSGNFAETSITKFTPGPEATTKGHREWGIMIDDAAVAQKYIDNFQSLCVRSSSNGEKCRDAKAENSASTCKAPTLLAIPVQQPKIQIDDSPLSDNLPRRSRTVKKKVEDASVSKPKKANNVRRRLQNASDEEMSLSPVGGKTAKKYAAKQEVKNKRKNPRDGMSDSDEEYVYSGSDTEMSEMSDRDHSVKARPLKRGKESRDEMQLEEDFPAVQKSQQPKRALAPYTFLDEPSAEPAKVKKSKTERAPRVIQPRLDKPTKVEKQKKTTATRKPRTAAEKKRFENSAYRPPKGDSGSDSD